MSNIVIENRLNTQEDGKVQKTLKKTGSIPRHIAIIMDGDRRWAVARSLPKTDGHRAARESVRDTVRACGQLGIDMLTLYAFSTENWNRAKYEIKALMSFLYECLVEETPELDENNVRLCAIGQLQGLPEKVQKVLQQALAQTAGNTGLQLNLALNYGGRSELVDAIKHLAKEVQEGQMKPEDIDEDMVSGALYTAGMPDPDLLIRTSGEMRLSNFLPWQMVYTEIWFADHVHWPDFRRVHLYEAIRAYQKRQRRFGGG